MSIEDALVMMSKRGTKNKHKLCILLAFSFIPSVVIIYSYFKLLHGYSTSIEKILNINEKLRNVKVYEYIAPNGMRPEELMKCFRDKYHLSPVTDTEGFPKKPYLPEDLSEWFLHKQIKASTHKSIVKEKADIFVVNTMPVLSEYVGDCNGMNHEYRQKKWVEIIKESDLFQSRPHDHLFICQSWTCAKSAVSPDMTNLALKMTYLIHEPNTYWVNGDKESNFLPSKLPENLIVIPYLAHSNIIPFNEKPWVERSYKISFVGSLERRSNWRDVLTWPTVKELSYLHILDEGVGDEISDGNETKFDQYVTQMTNSQFCLILQGDTPSSRRLFDAMISGCIPVFTGPKYSMPFEHLIPYDRFSVRIHEIDWFNHTKKALGKIEKISTRKAMQMQSEMKQYMKYIQWRKGQNVLDGILNDLHFIQNDLTRSIQWHICVGRDYCEYSNVPKARRTATVTLPEEHKYALSGLSMLSDEYEI